MRFPDSGTPFICPECGGIFDYDGSFQYQEPNAQYDGVWGYKNSIGLQFDGEPLTLGEGGTPLIWDHFQEYSIGLKCEYLNPTGSYKDRGTTVLINFLKSRNIKDVVEDSSGNAGASLAAYASRAGISSEIFIPDSASGVKRTQIERYGSIVIPIPGSRSEATKAALAAINQAKAYASHAYMPFGLAGIATIAYEIVNQTKKTPGTIIAPVGQGGLLLGLMRGFEALVLAKVILKMPYFVGVQTKNCGPILEAYMKNQIIDNKYQGCSSIAEGVTVSNPIRGDAILKKLKLHSGEIIGIDEVDIIPAYHEIATRGYFVEPTSALVWNAFKILAHRTPGPHILILTGSGLKYNERN